MTGRSPAPSPDAGESRGAGGRGPAEASASAGAPHGSVGLAAETLPTATQEGTSPEQAEPLEALRRQASRATRYLLRPRSYAGLAREAGLTAVHLSTYPLGLLPGLRSSSVPRPDDADTVGDDAAAGLDEATARTPIVLLHGYVHNRSAFIVMSRALRRTGFMHVRGINYNPLSQDLATIAGYLAAEVDDVLAETGAPRCKIVGHSMGGIVARHYVQLMGGDEKAETVVTLGSPHRGSYTSYVGFGPAAAQLRPGSTYLRHLEATARPSDVRWIAYYSDLDLMVVPAVHAKLVHPALAARNVRIRDTGHLSLLMSREVLRRVTVDLSTPVRADAP